MSRSSPGRRGHPENTSTHKWCPKCEVVKERSEYWASGTRDGNYFCCKECARQYSAMDYQKHKERRAESKRCANYRRLYGITLEQYEALRLAQGGKCCICAKPCEDAGGRGQLHVDHCHETGEIRGLLCHRCNLGIGYFQDNPSLLAEAILYLRGEDDH